MMGGGFGALIYKFTFLRHQANEPGGKPSLVRAHTGLESCYFGGALERSVSIKRPVMAVGGPELDTSMLSIQVNNDGM